MARTILFTASASKREHQKLIPAIAIQILQHVMEYGAENGKSGWHDIPVRVHLQRAKKHIELWMAGDRTERHIRHAFARLMMAVVLSEAPEEVKS